MEVYFYPAECGDAARIRFLGDDKKYHNIFIDSGYKRTFNAQLKSVIKNLIKNDEHIDLWVVTHIHDDHIGGIEQYISCIESGELKDIVISWIYNAPRGTSSLHEDEISIATSIRQGDILAAYLDKINKPSIDDYIFPSSIIDVYGLDIKVLSPTKKKLQVLRKKYDIRKGKQLERSENDSISSPVSSDQNDYHIKLMDFDFSIWKEDASIENGSSITVLTELNNKRILWLADSHPSDITNALRDMGYTHENELVCDWVKVAHHGSKGNNSKELYSMISCENYLFSANGENKDNLPSKEVIARILRNSNRDIKQHINIVFTYDNFTLRSIFNNESHGIFDELNFSVQYGCEL